MRSSLAATYTGPVADSSAKLLLRQGKWSRYVGKVTKGEMVRWVAAAIGGKDYQAKVDCGLAGDAVVCTIEAYPFFQDLAYRLVSSWGELSERSVELVEIRDEQVQFRLTDTAATEFPARAIRAVQWTAECLDVDGNVTAPPPLWADGETLRSGAVVYGTATVHYVCERHTSILNAPRRETALDNHWSAVVVAAIPGSMPARLLLELPPGIDALDEPDAVCGRRGGGRSSVKRADGSMPPPEPDGADLITEVDYCDQRTIREYTQ